METQKVDVTCNMHVPSIYVRVRGFFRVSHKQVPYVKAERTLVWSIGKSH